MEKYIYQHKNWTDFTWDDKQISVLLAQVRNLQGRLLGKMTSLGFGYQEEATLENITLDILKSSEIEGEKLNKQQVRSSIARRLGIDAAGLVSSTRNIDGIVEMMLDATQRYENPLTEERMFGWHAALFPTGYSSGYKIDVACYRKGEMQVVSGAYGKEKIHYEAVKTENVKPEMDKFLKWMNSENKNLDSIIKTAIAHLWFVTIHPFDDGNGRIARTISDMLLARSDESKQRFYSMSAQILKERNKYYHALEKIQHHADSDITIWLDWFLNCLKTALLSSEKILQSVLQKADFWNKNIKITFNDRQIKMLNKLLDGDFRGKLQSSKWAKICKCSQDTAIRDIKDLIEKGILQQEQQGGRSTNYELSIMSLVIGFTVSSSISHVLAAANFSAPLMV
jgi:Fic family protein